MTVDTVSNNDYLKKLHNEILIIMDEIDRICKLRGLRYYLCAGTCLGALRHRGFIPWDDDLDIEMPYDDFKRFISTLEKDLNSSFYLEWVTTDENYHQDFAKICLKNTVFVEDGWEGKHSMGIFVDIFPLYPSKGYSKVIQVKKEIYNFLHASMFCRGGKKLDWKLHNWPVNIVSKLVNSQTIYRMMVYVIHPLKEPEALYYACYSSTYPIKRNITPIDWYRECLNVKFEDRVYWCAIDSPQKMRLMYGENYMELPPIHKRKTHYPLFVKFCDGSILRFARYANKLSYKDVID